MLFIATFKALRDLLLPGILKILLWCMLTYGVFFGLLIWLLDWAINRFTSLTDGQGFAAHLLAGAGGIVLAWFLLPLLYPILVGFFEDDVAETIDRADYPQRPAAQAPFWPSLAGDLIFTIKAIALNVVCLPLFFVPVLGLFVYYGLNGYLLGTQFFRMAAGRRIDRAAADQLQRQNFVTIFAAGVAISFFATIPLVNLAAPILGIATMLHLFYLLQDRAQA